ncbi:hypothetical protein [Nocardia sp. NPDC048505]|uniref:hypothetical protein n=1 Tax=unclassified Nocardia TaxID=2637762 RepID=UPI00340CF4FD
MSNYATEIERIFEEHRRRSVQIQMEVDEFDGRAAEREQAFQDHANTWLTENGEAMRQKLAQAEEQERAEMEARAEQERLLIEAREHREAIARAEAARRSRDVVYPVDDDGDDPEGEYYRRDSWLV